MFSAHIYAHTLLVAAHNVYAHTHTHTCSAHTFTHTTFRWMHTTFTHTRVYIHHTFFSTHIHAHTRQVAAHNMEANCGLGLQMFAHTLPQMQETRELLESLLACEFVGLANFSQVRAFGC